jgi:type IV pilus assembly protein PilM
MASARFAWGIDIGNRALKAVRLVRDGNDQLKIDDFDVIEHEQILSQSGDNRESLIQAALAHFSQRHATKGGAVGIGVSGQASFARFIKLPPVAPNKIPEIVRFEAIQQIPFPLEDVEWSYQLFSTPDSPDVEVGIFAMRKELVNQNIKAFTDVGVDVHVVQMNPLAVYNALQHDDRLKGTTMVIDLGAENTDLIIAEGEGIWMRSIPIGGNNFTEALVKAFKLKFNKAEELKRNAATSKYGRQILQAMRPIFADLVAEIQRSIGFYASTHRDSRIARVLALGGTFRLPGLQKYLQQNLQLDVQRVDRLGLEVPTDAKFAPAFNDNSLSAISAYGLALQAIGTGQTKITSSLLPEKIQRERMWRDKQKWFMAAAATFLLGSGVAMGSLYLKGWEYDQQHAKFGNDLTTLVRKADNLDKAWAQIESSGGDERKMMVNLAGAINDRDIEPSLAVDLLSAFPKEQTAEELRKTPRGKRQVVLLEGWKQSLITDLNPLIDPTLMSATDFAKQADLKFDAYARTARDAMDQGLGGIAAPRPGANKKMKAVEQIGVRGALITLRCRTPNALPNDLVKNTIMKNLEALSQGSPTRPANYAIMRMAVAEVRPAKAEDRPAPATKRTGRRGFKAMFGAPTARPPGVGGAGIGGQPGGIGGQPGGIGGPPGAPGTFVDTNQPTIDPWEDPLVPGESMKGDSIVTLVLAVAFDPPAPPANPNAPKVASNQ